MKLSELQPGQTGIIVKILGHGAFRKRVMEMGFVKGRPIRVVLNAPLADPVKYSIMGYEVSLRRAEAALIEVVSDDDNDAPGIKLHDNAFDECDHSCEPARDSNDSAHHHSHHHRVINVALLGNPNCGKTSLFNIMSGGHEHVGNYAGVTVDAKAGSMEYRGYRINLVDLPGTYSLSAYSPEEQYVLRYLREQTPDVIVDVVVASNLERNLYLTTELIDMNRSMVVALNMFDELKKHHIQLNYEHLGKMLGVPIVPTIAATGYGVERLLDTIIDVYEMRQPDVRHIHVGMRPELEQAVRVLNDEFKTHPEVSSHFSPRYLAIKFLEKDPEVDRLLSSHEEYAEWSETRDKELQRLASEFDDDVTSMVAAEKYGFIQGALAETQEGGNEQDSKSTRIIDAFVTNKLFGFPIFFIAMWFMFWATFKIGAYPMEWIEAGVAWLSDIVNAHMPGGPLKDLLLDGVIGGVGSVIVFLPNILILYALISFMEDSGYMARVAFIMDKVMHRMGLHGKSFIPLVMGFGCNVPSIISSRIIESRSSRIITILVVPFMSCSARIPIYVLLVGCFFPSYGAWIFAVLYMLGILVAVLSARMLRKFWFKSDETPFVMELPPYRMPTARATIRGMWSKASQYIKKMGGLILVASAIIWALSYFPHYTADDVPAAYLDQYEKELQTVDADISDRDMKQLALGEYQLENSILGNIGRVAEPVMKPVDLDWKATVALLAGLPAKEVVVSTLGVIYTGDGDDSALLSQRLSTVSPFTGKAPFTPLTAFAFMVFVLLYFPCVATLTAIAKETGSWKYAFFSAAYNTTFAWILAMLVVQIGNLL